MAIITMSADSFAGAMGLAEIISKHLDYRFVTQEDIIEKTADYGMSADTIDRARRRHLGWRPRMDLEWIHYIACVRAAVSKEIQRGNLFYFGNNGQEILVGYPNVMHIKVDVAYRERIKNLEKLNDYAIKRKSARNVIETTDKKEVIWGRTIYNDGKHELSDFDLVMDPKSTTASEACELVQNALQQPRLQTTPKSLETIDLLTIAAELRTRIAVDLDIGDDNVEVEVRDGAINIIGSVSSKEDSEAIAALLHERPLF